MAAKKFKPVSEKRKVFLKTNHEKIKPENLNPAERNIYNKRKAGLVRQSTAIKYDNGKFANQYFINEISRALLASKGNNVAKIPSDNTKKFAELLKNADVKKEDLKEYFLQNKETFADTLKNGTLTGTSKDSDDLETILDTFKRKIFVNNGNGEGKKEVTAIEAKMLLKQFKQKILTTCNAADFAMPLKFTFDGELILNIPDVKILMDKIKEKLDLTNQKNIIDTDPAERSDAIENSLDEMYENDHDIIIYLSK